MAGDTDLRRLLETLAQVAIEVELRPTLQILLNSLHDIVPFDAGGIFVLEPRRAVVRAHATHGYPADFDMPSTDGIVGAVVRTGQPRVVEDVHSDPAYVPARAQTASLLTVPLASPRGIMGAISLESDRRHAFHDEDQTLVLLFAQQATVAVERALLHEQHMRQSRLDRELEIAGEILQSLTPKNVPPVPGFQVFGRSLTAESVGGDSFDFIAYPECQFGVSIADAKGKGLPAALLAVAHRAMLHALVSVELRLRATFTRINDLLARSLPPGNFITAFYGIVDTTERRMVYANAGHLPPLAVRRDGTIDVLDVTGQALGFPRATTMRESYAAFEPGEGVVLFTDGVTDVGPEPDAFFDVSGVSATVQGLWHRPAAEVCQGLLDEVVRRAAGPIPDDATVVVVKFE